MGSELGRRLAPLDFLRGIAVLLVLGRHFPDAPREAALPFALWHRIGGAGVELFFVLSGFLVSGLIFSEWKKHGEFHPARFLARRSMKILPTFYLMLFASVFIFYPVTPWKRVLTEAFFLQNYLMGVSQIWNHTWSLAIEEHFYLLLSALFFILTRRKNGEPFAAVPRIFLAVALFCLAARASSYARGASLNAIFMQTHHRVDTLFFGVLMAYFYHFRGEEFRLWIVRRRRHLFLAVPVLLAPPLFQLLPPQLIPPLSPVMLYLGFGALIASGLYSEDRPRCPRPAFEAVRFIGVHSYSIYVWHMLCRNVLLKEFELHPQRVLGFYAKAGIFLAAALGAGIFVSMFFEMPLLRLRDRLFPSRSR